MFKWKCIELTIKNIIEKFNKFNIFIENKNNVWIEIKKIIN